MGALSFEIEKKRFAVIMNMNFLQLYQFYLSETFFPILLKSLIFRELSTIDHLIRPALDPREAKLGSPDQSLHFRANRQLEFLDTAMDEVVRRRGSRTFTLVGAPWIGEGSGYRQGPQRVQGSARWGALGGEAPRKLMRIRNLRR